MVDNCYGEFVETVEPSDVGADMIVGSLIKNPGGGLAPIGGYIAGTKECVENAAYTSDLSGTWQGSRSISWCKSDLSIRDFSLHRLVTQGALKGAVFAANIYEKLGFPVVPNGREATSRYHSGS